MASTSSAVAEARLATTAAPEWVVFECGGPRFGVPIRTVREIVAPKPYTRLPGCGPAVCGLIGLRGRIVTVLDFAAAVGLPPVDRHADHRLLLIDDGARVAGFAVQAVAGVTPADPDRLPLTAAELRGLDVDGDALLGIGRMNDQPFVAVDPIRMLARLLLHPQSASS